MGEMLAEWDGRCVKVQVVCGSQCDIGSFHELASTFFVKWGSMENGGGWLEVHKE